MPDTLSKPDLRRTMRAALRALPSAEIASRSARLVECLKADGGWASQGRAVALFGGLPEEPDLLPLLPWLREKGARTVFFAVCGKDLVAYEVRSPDDLRRGTLGVWEPVTDAVRLVAAADISVVLTPGLAFGRTDGSRLGRGAGFYDRLFSLPGMSARRIGVAFDCQVIDQVPTEAHDARVEAVVTESGWLRF